MREDTERNGRCTLTLPNDIGLLPAALAFARQVAEYIGFDGANLSRIELALEEAVANVVEHAYAPDESATFDIVFQRSAGGMEILIHDMGLPWDPTLDEDYDPAADLDSRNAQGLGKHLIKELMDEYAFENLGRHGKQIRMVKYLDTRNIAEEMEEAHAVGEVEPPENKPPPVELEFRRMRPEEAIEASRAIFDCYGYSYAGEFMYFPERVAAMNENGQMLSAVAVVKETGEVAGHNALLFNDSLPAELAVAVTKRQFRGLGIARSLGEFLAEQAREMGLKGLYVKEVTVHPYTQKFCRKLGYDDCGLLLAHSPKSLAFKGIAETADQRNSDLLGFRKICEAEPRKLYLPERHAGIIEEIYNGLDIPMNWVPGSGGVAKNEQTLMKAAVNSSRSLCEIHIPHYGSDLVKLLKQELRRVRRNEVQLVEMYLSLTDPVTPWVVNEAEKLGFFFTGVLPETDRGDAVILQFFNGIAVEYEELIIERSETRKLLDYVKSQDPSV